MRGMGAQAVLLGIVLCVEDDSTSESREPKNGGKQNAFVLLPSGHGGSRTPVLFLMRDRGIPI